MSGSGVRLISISLLASSLKALWLGRTNPVNEGEQKRKDLPWDPLGDYRFDTNLFHALPSATTRYARSRYENVVLRKYDTTNKTTISLYYITHSSLENSPKNVSLKVKTPFVY